MKRQRGFTLLEMLVALAIFATIYMISHNVLGNILDSSAALTKQQRQWQELNIAFVLLEDDLTFASQRKVRDIDGTLLPALMGQAADSRALSPPVLELTRSGLQAVDDGQETGLRRVAWRLDDKKLYRDTWPVLDRAPDSKPVSRLVLEEVQDITVRFYQDNGQWAANWPPPPEASESGQPPDLPAGIEVVITLPDDVELKRVLRVNG